MNNKKEIFLSVLGILILISVVVGISFAFFTYTRTGAKNNSITSGKLLFNYHETNELYLTDVYPTQDDVATANPNNDFTFTISGYIVGDLPITYNIYGIKGDTVDSRNRLRDYEVKIKLTGSTDMPDNVDAISIKNGYDGANGNIVAKEDGTLKETDSLVLATGKIIPNINNITETHTYLLKMWVPSSIVTIGQTTKTNGVTTNYSSSDYKNLYYSMRINVRANATNNSN